MPDGRRPGPIRSWLQLMRFPAVFTALADICAGFAVKTSGFEPVGDFGRLLAASAGLYLSGMVLNDVFDRHRDAVERPGRPIPSGRVGVMPAAALGAGLMLFGLIAAAMVSQQALWVALCLGACVLAYDGILKATPLGPVAMGGCRFLNVMLGASVIGGDGDVPSAVLSPPQLYVAAAIGIYVAGVTWFARTEEKASRRWSLLAGAAVANLGIAVLAGTYYGWPPRLAWPWHGGVSLPGLAMLTGVIALMIDVRVVVATLEPSPRRVQAAVKAMLLAIIILDATAVLAQTGERTLAVGTAALVVPALLLGRWVYVT